MVVLHQWNREVNLHLGAFERGGAGTTVEESRAPDRRHINGPTPIDQFQYRRIAKLRCRINPENTRAMKKKDGGEITIV
jgi:hypothetical protein